MVDITPYMQCINQVHPTMIQRIINVESDNNPIAINVNKKDGIKPRYKQPRNKSEAVKLAQYYISNGYTVDLGYMQINSNNLRYYGVSVQDMFEPCKNIYVGSTILLKAYQQAKVKYQHPQLALRHALSIYNTGNMYRGFQNGYVKKYTKIIQYQNHVKQSNHINIPINNLYKY